MAGIIVSLGIAVVGLWFAVGQGGTGMAGFGWLLLALGLGLGAGNLYLRRRGFGTPHRRP
jgi:hypothetical protein